MTSGGGDFLTHTVGLLVKIHDWFVMCSAAKFKCPEGEFQCNSTRACIPVSQVCDGYPHCDDESDENTDCTSTYSHLS